MWKLQFYDTTTPFGFVNSSQNYHFISAADAVAKNECETMKEHEEMNLSLESRLLDKEK